MERYQLNGAILVADGAEVYFTDAFGFADKEKDILNTVCYFFTF